MSHLHLENFTSNEKIVSYLDAIIKSGIAADIDHGIVFLVGNSGIGKTSLALTLKAYIENPTDSPCSKLAGIGECEDDLETQLSEVYKDVPFEQPQNLAVKLTPTKKGTKKGATLVDFIKESSSDKTSANKNSVKIRLVDMGGHQEYYACSFLFIQIWTLPHLLR